LVVDNVHEFTGHIPCDCNSNSEIVIPIIKNNQLLGVLDIDSPKYNRFDETLKTELEALVKLLVDIL
jgi:GAF domain-containing protein